MDIYDIPFDDVEEFLAINGISVDNRDDRDDSDEEKTDEEIYEEALELMKNPKTNYKGAAKSIIEWMKAYNLVKSKARIPYYYVYQVRSLNDKDLVELARSLTMKTTNIDSILSILDFLHKLNTNNINNVDNIWIRGILEEDRS
jgi:hypothetical protein